MVAILDGRDPSTAEGEAYASTRGDIEPPARSIHMVSEPILPPATQKEEPSEPPAEGQADRQPDESDI
jgi:cell division protease FtsH